LDGSVEGTGACLGCGSCLLFGDLLDDAAHGAIVSGAFGVIVAG